VDRLRYWAEVQPTEVAYHFTEDGVGGSQVTFSQLDLKVRAVAARLQSMGLTGSRALLLYPPGLDFVTGFFGCLLAGVTAVPAFPPRRNRKMERIEAISDNARAGVVLTEQDVLERAQAVIDETPHLKQLPWLATDLVESGRADAWQPRTIAADQPAVLQYTSGSTGTPKGVMLSHRNLLHNCSLIAHGFGAGRRDGGLTWLPTYHDMGLVGGVLFTAYFGRPNVLMPPMAFLQKPIRWLRGISTYRAAISGGPNFAYALCCDKITEEECHGLDLSCWDVAFNGAEPVRAETLRRFTEKFAPYGFRAAAHYPCYGMAETTLIITGGTKTNPPRIGAYHARDLESNQAVPAEMPDSESRELVSCGQPLPDIEVAIVDRETHRRLPQRQIGEILVAGPSVAQGYWDNPAETERVFHCRIADEAEKAYLKTGDLGFLDDGELFVTGRCKDLIIIRGRNIYPHDIERIVENCHAALRAGGGAAFSVQADGEERLIVVHEVERHFRQSDLTEIITAIREAVLDEQELLVHGVLLMRMGRLPMTSSGKVQRHLCRSEYLEGKLDALASWSLDQDKIATSSDANSRAAGGSSTSVAAGPIEAWLVARLAKQLNRPASDIDVEAPFARFGLDSATLVGITGELEDWLGRSISPTLPYSYPTISALAQHLAQPSEDTSSNEYGTSLPQHEPIAIVGIGCRFPGAEGPEAFWNLLRHGVDATSDVPADRWKADLFADGKGPGRIATRRGAFISDVDQFDPQFFNISPREAIGIDPQQRLLLEVAWETLENAGQPLERLTDSDTGVFVGISNCDYARIAGRDGDLSTIDAYTGTGTTTSVAAGRLAYFLGVHGPSLVVDTACSSSLAAVHLAVQSLRNKECRAALAGGVNLILDPSSSIALTELQALSPSGRCKTFDDAADGYVRGEGCGMVLLKRLADAVQDGDTILALVRGSAINHNGRSNGLTAPHGPTQESLIRHALADGGVRAAEVGYVEAHGTGTSLGDPIEVQALASVYGEGRPADQPLAISSVKTNIGHLEAAAGIAGLIKLVLSLRHGHLLPHLNLTRPNAHIPWDQLPVKVPTEFADWSAAERRRIGGVSSFGFSGTNVHMVVEEAPQLAAALVKHERPEHVLVLSAKTEEALRDLAAAYANPMAFAPEVPLADVAHAAAVGRTHFQKRLAVVAGNLAEARQKLTELAKGRLTAGLFNGTVDPSQPPKLAFLFTGQGAQYVGMARELYENQPTFRKVLDRCDAILRNELGFPLLDVLYPASEDASPLDGTAYTQPALFAVEYALYELWKSWGVDADLLVGHSVGEYVAATVAGVLSLDDALRLVVARGRLMQDLAVPGLMAAVAADESRVRAAIDACGVGVDIAAVNSPTQTVISGAAAAVQQLASWLEADGVQVQMLNVSHAFHSALMEPMLAEFEKVLRSVEFRAPQKAIISNVHARAVTNEMSSPEYWCEQIRRTVRFADSMQELGRLGANVFIEIGPAPILTAAGQACFTGGSGLWLPSLRKNRGNWSQLLESIAQLYVRGVRVDWIGFDRDYPRRKVSIPNYPFQREHYWLDGNAGTQLSATRPATAAGKVHSANVEDWMFELAWQPRSRLDQRLTRSGPDYFPSPFRLAEQVQPEVSRLQRQLQLPRYQELSRQLDRLCVGYVREALHELGWKPRPGQSFTTDELTEELHIAAAHQRLLDRMLGILHEEGMLRLDGDTWHVNDVPPLPDPQMQWSLIAPQFPECKAELTLLGACGTALGDVLAGHRDPLQVLFPDGSATMVERLYQDSPFARTLNTLVEEVIAQAVAKLPPGRVLKILEIGAGTGGTTSQVLPRLPAGQTEYVFTDVSELFTVTAQQKFRDYPFVRYGALDIEQDPTHQGYAPGQFDIVLAANVLHATRDIGHTLRHVRQLLAPGGMLVMLEGARPQRWLDLIFGLTDGWWRFADTNLRPNHPLMTGPTWLRVLEQSGFDDAVSLPENPDSADADECSPQIVVVAQADSAPQQSRGAGIPACHLDLPKTENTAPHPDNRNADSWLILADRGGLGERLAEQLRQLGEGVVVALHGDELQRLDADTFVLNPSSQEDFARLMREAFSGDARCRGVVHLWSLDTLRAEKLTTDDLDEATVLGSGSTLELVRQLARIPSPQPRVWLVTRSAQATNPQFDVQGLAQVPLWGVGRVLSEEHPDLWGGLIDLDEQIDPETVAERILQEIRTPDGEDQIALRGSERLAARLVRRPALASAARPLRWRTDASYLITGGLGDLGLRVAEWMAHQGARHLLLVSRTPFPARPMWDAAAEENPRQAERIRAIRHLEEQGVSVRIAAVDVADEAALRKLFSQIELEGCPPIRGVVHAAGVAEGRPLLDTSLEQFSDVLRSKVTGTWLLDSLLQTARLDLFVSFSSGAALLGSPMLGSYAAANAFLDAMAHRRTSLGRPALSVNWGFWEEVGMVARSQREAGRGFAPQGMQSFSVADGIAAMERLLRTGAVQTAVMPVDWPEWCQSHPRAARRPLLSGLLQLEAATLAMEEETLAAPAFDRAALLAAPADERRRLIEELLCGQLSRVLRMPVEQLDVQRPLNQLGIDSLMAVELRNHVQSSLGVAIPVAQLLQHPTIRQLRDVLDEQLAGGGVTEEADALLSAAASNGISRNGASMAQPAARQAADALARIDELSDEEVEAMLSQMQTVADTERM